MEPAESPSEELTLQSKGYKIIRKLGEGSYAKVYLADFANGKERIQLACKIINVQKAPKDYVVKFLPRELDILAKLNHPYIIHVHSIYLRKNKYFIFMRHAEEGDLLDYITKNGTLTEQHAKLWFRQMALAMQYLHNLDIAHRDLKCENALITRNFNIKLADFGFSRCVVDETQKMILSETYCGSLSYAAPEILHGKPYSPKNADVWSLGVILYVMLNKAMPFDDNHARKLYDQQMMKRWRFRSKIVDTISEQLKNLVANMLEPNHAKRIDIDAVLQSNWIANIAMNERERYAQANRVLEDTKKMTDLIMKQPPTKGEMKTLKETTFTSMASNALRVQTTNLHV